MYYGLDYSYHKIKNIYIIEFFNSYYNTWPHIPLRVDIGDKENPDNVRLKAHIVERKIITFKYHYKN